MNEYSSCTYHHYILMQGLEVARSDCCHARSNRSHQSHPEQRESNRGNRGRASSMPSNLHIDQLGSFQPSIQVVELLDGVYRLSIRCSSSSEEYRKETF